MRSKIFDDAELERLRREAIPSSNESAMAGDAAPHPTDQHPHVEAAIDLPVVVDSNDGEIFSHELEEMRSILEEPDITQKLTERIDNLKQKIAAWGKRIRRFTARSRRFNQNRLFQSDHKRLYKSLERPKVCGAGQGPDQADIIAFWRGLLSKPVNHNEGPWMEVVASQGASVTPMTTPRRG
ncbi:unnamed protein product [Parnassius apollo]|uniref:(apollo) hypothetical protein n=1 Tax=Parnassius apollo TaxID=110799 RepID=A0A8S3WA88_PARAO|nr:unnamed protein product [Parnassius apollo]